MTYDDIKRRVDESADVPSADVRALIAIVDAALDLIDGDPFAGGPGPRDALVAALHAVGITTNWDEPRAH